MKNKLTKKEAFILLCEKLCKHGFKKGGDLTLNYRTGDFEVTVQACNNKIQIIQQCSPISEGWSISEFGRTISGVEKAARRAKAEAALP